MLPPTTLTIALLRASLLLSACVHSQREAKCVPTGLCFPQVPEINPRIVTPEEGPAQSANSTACDAGYELCYPKEGPFECGKKYTPGISDANGVASTGAHPWQVYLMNDTNKYIGSGVLLTSRIVLTSAHKVYDNEENPGNIRIYFGLSNPTGLPPTPTVPPAASRVATEIIVHENFRQNFPEKKDYKDDIALVVMDRAYSMGYRIDLGLGCLPKNTDSFVGQSCVVAGWGETTFQKKNEGIIHKQVTVPIVSMDTCKESMDKVLGPEGTAKYLDLENELCAGGDTNKDACTQDGGAPLMCLDENTSKYVIAGLVIWGKGCGTAGVYGVYVDVTKYTTWINNNLSDLTAKQEK